MRTTHPKSPHWRTDTEHWAAELEAWCRLTSFTGLDILDAPAPDGDVGFVTFRAHVEQDGKAYQMEEESRFERVAGRWLYVEAVGG